MPSRAALRCHAVRARCAAVLRPELVIGGWTDLEAFRIAAALRHFGRGMNGSVGCVKIILLEGAEIYRRFEGGCAGNSESRRLVAICARMQAPQHE